MYRRGRFDPLKRVRRLRERGAIISYHAEIAPMAVDIDLQAMISVRLTRHTRTELHAFHAYLLAPREVLVFHHLAGANDYLLHVAVANSDHLRNFALERSPRGRKWHTSGPA